jgi:putative membrane protein
MSVVAGVLVGIVAALHAYFLVLEMFLWRTPRVRATFGTTEGFADESAALAANQGLYNGFLAAGLVWSLIAGDFGARVFFLICVVVAGVYGAAKANRRIIFVQALPAVLAIVFVLLAH